MVQLGDNTTDEFIPELTVGKWDEVSMKIKARENNLAKEKRKNKSLGSTGSEVLIEDEKIRYKEDGLDYVFYDIEPNDDYPE